MNFFKKCRALDREMPRFKLPGDGSEDFAQGPVQPFFASRKIGVSFKLRQHGVFELDAGSLKDGVVVERLSENFPTNGINRPVIAGINNERVPGRDLVAAGGVGEGIDEFFAAENHPIVVSPMEEAAGLKLVKQKTAHAQLGKGRVEETIEPGAEGFQTIVHPVRKAGVQKVLRVLHL